MRKLIFWASGLFFLLIILQVRGQQPGIGLITPLSSTDCAVRYAELLNILRDGGKYDVTLVDYAQADKVLKKQSFNLLILYGTDSSDFTSSLKSGKSLAAIRGYMDSGGNLLLGMEAMKLISALGLEAFPPEVRNKRCVDDGYGRKLGYHAYRDHPVFDGLNGGAYVQVPEEDITARIIGYFGDTVPQGNVVAVDWDYIFLRENSKLILEYKTGRGKVLAVGSYLFYDQPNRNKKHLEQFTRNLLAYCMAEQTAGWSQYWHYVPAEVTECEEWPQNDRMFPEIPAAKTWPELKSELTHIKSGGDEFFDIAGERMVMMGKEKGGIDEIWTHPFMSIHNYIAGVQVPSSDSVIWLDKVVPEVTITPFSLTRRYKFPEFSISEVLVTDPREPSGVVHYEYSGEAGGALVLRMSCNLRLMWPYSEKNTSSLCYRWLPDYVAYGITDWTGDLMVVAGANRQPERYHAGPDGDKQGIGLSYMYRLNYKDQLDFVITGTSQGFNETVFAFDGAIRGPRQILNSGETDTREVFSKMLRIITPDPVFNEGYAWALSATDKFFVNTPGMGASLVAGYSTTKRGWDGGHKINGRPGYAWYFGRDGQWSGFALLDYGDFEKVREILRFYEKYQDLTGKIFHEATTSGVVHYDASDATPLYIMLAGKYVRHSNDTDYLKSSWPSIKKALDYCFSTDTDKDHLIENTNVGHGWVEGGALYGSHATFYLNGCWAAALDEASALAKRMNDPGEQSYNQESIAVRTILNKNFWIPSPSLGGPLQESGYYSYGLNTNGTFRNEITVLPAVPLLFGQGDRLKAVSHLRYFSGNNFSSNWGVRIIGEDSPLFKPTGYHYGSVWPLFTGWTSLAEYRYGRYPQAFMHLMSNLKGYSAFAYGFVEEVLNGAEYKPSGVCPHQCWSETMVLQPAIEGMLGLHVDGSSMTVRMEPRLPYDWDSIDVRNIRIGGQYISMNYKRDSDRSVYRFTGNSSPVNLEFYPVFPAGTEIREIKVNEMKYSSSVFQHPDNINTYISGTITDTLIIEITHSSGIGVIPYVNNPKPGDDAAGPRILESYLAGSQYIIETEGPSGTRAVFRVYGDGSLIKDVSGTDELIRKGKITSLTVTFPSSDQKITRKSINITLNQE